MPSSPEPSRLRADIDPKKAPETAAKIREHVAKYGAATMTTIAKNLNTRDEGKERRKEAIGQQKKVRGMIIDEEPPASFQKPGDPVSTKPTPDAESRRRYSWETHFSSLLNGLDQAGKLGTAIKAARKRGADTLIIHGIEGEELGGQGSNSMTPCWDGQETPYGEREEKPWSVTCIPIYEKLSVSAYRKFAVSRE